MIMIMIVSAFLVAFSMGAPIDPEIFIVNETPLENIGTGDYKYGYQLSNGATREESAKFVESGPEGPAVQTVVGSFGWVNPFDNVEYFVRYTADKDGFHPQGDHLPF